MSKNRALILVFGLTTFVFLCFFWMIVSGKLMDFYTSAQKISDIMCAPILGDFKKDQSIITNGEVAFCYVLQNTKIKQRLEEQEEKISSIEWSIRSIYNKRSDLWDLFVTSEGILPVFECQISVTKEMKIFSRDGLDFCKYIK